MLMAFTAQAQVPQAISFQGMAMDANGGFITNETVAIDVHILENSPQGAVVYQEIHVLETSDLGHFTLEKPLHLVKVDVSVPMTMSWQKKQEYLGITVLI